MSQQYHFKKGSLVEFLNTDAMQKRAEEASRIVNKEKGTNFAQEKARIEAENAAAAKKRPMTKYGYNMEPWEQKTEFINLALSKGAGTAEAHELWKAQQAYIEDPKAEGAVDVVSELQASPDFDHEGNEIEMEEEETETEAEPATPAPDAPAPAPDAAPAPEDPAAPPEPEEEDPAQPLFDHQAQQMPGAEVAPMVQPAVQQSFRPIVQNEQDWMALKNSFSQQAATPQAAVGVDARAEQMQQGLDARSKKHRDALSKRNSQWANIGA